MKFKLVEDFDDLLLEYKAVIEPGSDLEKSLIYDIEHTDKPYSQIAKEYGIPVHTVRYFSHKKNLRDKAVKGKKLHVYFNTLVAHINAVRIRGIEANIKFLPSIYLGEYSVSNIESMYEYIRKKYLGSKVNPEHLIEFYLKIASKEISLNTLVTELKVEPTPTSLYHDSPFDYKFITASTEELSTVDFYSVNYPQLAKDILTFFSRKRSTSNDFDNQYKDLKAAAARVDPKTFDHINQIDTYISNNIENIAHNIYSEKGDIIEASNYINGIPYETSFNVSSVEDIATCMGQYKNYLLYGFMDNAGDIIYIGISIDADGRADKYAKENRLLILKAFKDKIIRKLIIFKSNLPIQSRTVNTKLIYALESYFAEHLFKTHPENYPKALNKAKPGQNSSGFLASQNRDKFELYISDQDTLLSLKEFTLAGNRILNIGNSMLWKLYPYYKYAEDYIAKHDGDLSVKDKQILYKSLYGDARHILWDICSSESEYRKIIPKHKNTYRIVNQWRNYCIENNLPITEDLDDDIDMEYYV